MKAKEYKALKEYNSLDLLYFLIEKCEALAKDTEESLKENKSAGTRVRIAMSEIKIIADAIRDYIQFSNKPGMENNRPALEKAIAHAEEMEAKIPIKIEERKQARIKKLQDGI